MGWAGDAPVFGREGSKHQDQQVVFHRQEAPHVARQFAGVLLRTERR